jgi:hypothetical protein
MSPSAQRQVQRKQLKRKTFYFVEAGTVAPIFHSTSPKPPPAKWLSQFCSKTMYICILCSNLTGFTFSRAQNETHDRRYTMYVTVFLPIGTWVWKKFKQEETWKAADFRSKGSNNWESTWASCFCSWSCSGPRSLPFWSRTSLIHYFEICSCPAAPPYSGYPTILHICMQSRINSLSYSSFTGICCP